MSDKNKMTAILMHLQPQKAQRLQALANEMRMTRSVLIREAIDDLLVKYGKWKYPRRRLGSK